MTTRLIGLAIVGAFLTAGSVVAPAQAAPVVKPVTSGNAQFVIQAPAGVQSDWVSAQAPGRVTPTGGLVFPISSVSSNGKMVVLSGAMMLNRTPYPGQPYGVSLELDQSTHDMNVVLKSLNTASDPVAAFFSNHMTSTSTVKTNKAKKTRTTTTVWSGDLLLHSGAASDLEFAQLLNQLYGVTAFTPGMNLGRVTLTISRTVPCKNAACTA